MKHRKINIVKEGRNRTLISFLAKDKFSILLPYGFHTFVFGGNSRNSEYLRGKPETVYSIGSDDIISVEDLVRFIICLLSFSRSVYVLVGRNIIVSDEFLSSMKNIIMPVLLGNHKELSKDLAGAITYVLIKTALPEENTIQYNSSEISLPHLAVPGFRVSRCENSSNLLELDISVST